MANRTRFRKNCNKREMRMPDFKPQIWNGVPIPYGASVGELRATIADGGPKAWAAIRALAEKPDAEALAVLVQLTQLSDPHRRRAAIEAIGMHRSGQTASEAICQALHDPEARIVRAAMEAAANLNLPRAHDQLLSLVKASDENTRIAALGSLEKLWQPADFESVFYVYRNDPCERVRKQAAWTLHPNGGEGQWAVVCAAWSTDTVP